MLTLPARVPSFRELMGGTGDGRALVHAGRVERGGAHVLIRRARAAAWCGAWFGWHGAKTHPMGQLGPGAPTSA
eukprot:5595356-Alexandrium_andersonii.AAC.1